MIIYLHYEYFDVLKGIGIYFLLNRLFIFKQKDYTIQIYYESK